MDGLISLIIFALIGFVFSKVKKAAKTQNSNAANTSTPKTTFQSQLNQVLDQISEIKNTAVEQSRQSFDINANARTTQSHGSPNTIPAYRSSLEGDIVEGYQVEGYQMEGTAVEGKIVEGQRVEGLAQKHSTTKFSNDRAAYTESSMKRGFAGEGCDDHYDLNIKYSSSSARKVKKQTLNFSDNPIIQGVVMAQILERPKR